MRVARLVLATVIVLALTACSEAPVAVDRTSDVVAELPRESLSEAGPVRLADGTLPPTNRWYSSLVFSPEPLPIYPYPLAVAPRLDGFAMQLPPVTASATTISAGFTGGLSVALGATGFTVVRADPVSVTLAYADDDGTIAEVTLAEGSPVVAVAAQRDLALPVPPLDDVATGSWTTAVGGVTYLLDAPSARAGSGTLTVPTGSALQIAPLPEDGDAAEWAAALGAPVTAVETSSEVGDDAVTTRLTYTGTDETVVVPFAGRDAAAPCTLGTYDTAYGPASACAGSTLEWSVPTVSPASAYDLDEVAEATLTAIGEQVRADLEATPSTPADTYFGGKALARLATLVTLAHSAGDEELAARVADRLADEIAPWLDPEGCAERDERCLVYDDRLALVVGKATGFGSEDGNDHHFHYGYFLFAAAVLAGERPDLLDSLRPVVDALAADIALGAVDLLPRWRVYDPYRGHSWAAGLSPFADGNDQESSSEAVAAWNGLALWAEATDDDAARDTALWLLANEAASARELWLEPDHLPDSYAHPIVSLTWSAKRDHATWFSAEPSAILGIQLLPLGPVSLEAMAADPDRVAVNIADAGDAAFTGPLGDYVLVYSALAGTEALESARARVEQLPADAFDDGWSKAAALAFIAAAASR